MMNYLGHDRNKKFRIDSMNKWLAIQEFLYAFKLAQLASFENKNSFELSTQK